MVRHGPFGIVFPVMSARSVTQISIAFWRIGTVMRTVQETSTHFRQRGKKPGATTASIAHRSVVLIAGAVDSAGSLPIGAGRVGSNRRSRRLPGTVVCGAPSLRSWNSW